MKRLSKKEEKELLRYVPSQVFQLKLSTVEIASYITDTIGASMMFPDPKYYSIRDQFIYGKLIKELIIAWIHSYFPSGNIFDNDGEKEDIIYKMCLFYFKVESNQDVYLNKSHDDIHGAMVDLCDDIFEQLDKNIDIVPDDINVTGHEYIHIDVGANVTLVKCLGDVRILKYHGVI